MIVESRPGTSGAIGAQAVVRSPSDGYTLFIGAGSSTTIQAALSRNLPFDPIRDFASITPLAGRDYVLIINQSTPVRTFDEFIALAKSERSGLTFGSAGTGSVSHLAGELLKSSRRLNLVHVPYQGGAPAMNDLLGGHVSFVINDISVALPHIKAGKLLALATTGRKRSRFLPDVPTIVEAGVAGYEAQAWYGLLAPRGTSADIVEKLNTEVRKIMDRTDVKARLEAAGSEPFVSTPGEFAEFLKADLERWSNEIKVNEIKP